MFTEPTEAERFYDEIKEYCDEHGLVGAHKNPKAKTTGNAILFTATALNILKTLSRSDQEKQLWKDWLWSKPIEKCYVVPGLLNRYPGLTDKQSHDDYIGAVTIGGNNLAGDVQGYGQENSWCFDNTKPYGRFSIRNWHGRFPGLIQHYKASCGSDDADISILGELWWSIGMLYTAFFSRGTSGWILSWFKFHAMPPSGYVYKEANPDSATLISRIDLGCKRRELRGGRYKLARLAKRIWLRRLKIKFPHLMGDVFGIYHGFEHPFSKYMMDKI